MPPRINTLLFQCLRAQVPSPNVTRSLTSTPSVFASTVAQKRKRRDPYAIAQAKAKKAANMSRREVIEKERAATLGDPVRGVTTPFVESFDNALPLPSSTSTSKFDIPAERGGHLNFFLKEDELDNAINRSKWLNTRQQVDSIETDITAEDKMRVIEEQHEHAAEALRRIANLSLGSNKDRQRVNNLRAIEVFGRHNTDQTLPPRPGSDPSKATRNERAGTDTGSSEVQIAILTAKIRKLADFLQTRGPQDKMNKRNLRVLVHRRQKLLQYLRRRERGGPRWQHLVETLGLTEGTWKGEISL